MPNTIFATTYNESLEFTGHLLGMAEGKPYPDCDNYNEYEIYKRESDGFYVCVNFPKDAIEVLETKEEVISFFGFDPISKELFDTVGFKTAEILSTPEHGTGEKIILNTWNDVDYEFVGQLIHRSLLGFYDCILEIYKLNTGNYVCTEKSERGYSDVRVLDDQALVELLG
ncbi:hypothetical protein HCY52_15000 [Acinetobacter radioresistens]|uniref:hypothetical protein n=1 Tax=Acinetobacter radioresistens TaxID=40216 RepID=UPI00200577F3|nr:hypothetical protein [Acinetobacter radioresistens]MCK4085120.1 hypothetical protein [Acinetobacter radioresistens]